MTEDSYLTTFTMVHYFSPPMLRYNCVMIYYLVFTTPPKANLTQSHLPFSTLLPHFDLQKACRCVICNTSLGHLLCRLNRTAPVSPGFTSMWLIPTSNLRLIVMAFSSHPLPLCNCTFEAGRTLAPEKDGSPLV